jgi:hypothetical protein
MIIGCAVAVVTYMIGKHDGRRDACQPLVSQVREYAFEDIRLAVGVFKDRSEKCEAKGKAAEDALAECLRDPVKSLKIRTRK